MPRTDESHLWRRAPLPDVLVDVCNLPCADIDRRPRLQLRVRPARACPLRKVERRRHARSQGQVCALLQAGARQAAARPPGRRARYPAAARRGGGSDGGGGPAHLGESGLVRQAALRRVAAHGTSAAQAQQCDRLGDARVARCRDRARRVLARSSPSSLQPPDIALSRHRHFALNEVFEHEAAGRVEVLKSDLGVTSISVYLGLSLEGVLRHRETDELKYIFRNAYVCIRRWCANKRQLLPLVMDAERLSTENVQASRVALAHNMYGPASASALAAALAEEDGGGDEREA